MMAEWGVGKTVKSALSRYLNCNRGCQTWITEDDLMCLSFLKAFGLHKALQDSRNTYEICIEGQSEVNAGMKIHFVACGPVM